MDMHIPPNALPIVINKFRTPASVWASEERRNGMSQECYQLFDLERRLSQSIVNNRRKESVPFREVDEIVAVQSLDDPRKWLRGKIEDRMEYQTGPRYKVFLLDQGITVRAKPEQLRSLPFKVDEVPYQAMIIVLEGIVPTSLALSPDLDNFHLEFSDGWTSAAEKFVKDIWESYTSAWFVRKDDNPSGQVNYGDILISSKNSKPVSLKELLCEKNFAKYNRAEFEKRLLKIKDVVDAPEICESPLSYGYLTDTNDSTSPSPARSMLCSPKPTVVRPTISEYLASQSAEKGKALIPQSPTSPDAERIVTSPQAGGRLALLAKLKQSNSTSSNTGTIEPTLVPVKTPTKGSNGIEEQISASVHPHRSPVGMSSPKALSPCFIPAGYAIKQEAKALSRPSSSSSHMKSSDSEDSFHNDSKPSMKFKNGSTNAFKPSINGQDHGVNTKFIYTSDSSISDSASPSPARSMLCSPKHNVAKPTGSALLSVLAAKGKALRTGHVPNGAVPQADCSNTSRSPSLPGRMSLLSKLKKQEATLPSSKTDESSSSESSTPKGFHRAVQPATCSSNQQINEGSSGLTRNRLLSAPKISVSVDDDTSTESYLARPVLLHGGLPPKPWVVFNDLKLKFSSTIEQYLMTNKWCYNIMTLEKYMWPAIQQRQNVIMISPARSGKTTSYIIPLMDFMCNPEEIPMGCGPRALILCSGSQSVSQILFVCLMLLRHMKNSDLQVKSAVGLAITSNLIFEILNGCDIFITTPPCLLRIMKNHSYVMNFHRLEHFILDEADIMMTRFLKEVREIQAKVVAEQAIRTKDDKDPIQVVVSSEKWESHLLSFSEHLRGNPLLCINDSFEACVYGKPDVFFHLTQSSQKLSKLIQVLRGLIDLQKVVVFCDESEISGVHDFIENACMNCLVVQPCTDARTLDAIHSSWDSSKVGKHYILVCPDSEFVDLKITDATSVVHYSLPADKSYLYKRLSAILNSLPNKIEEKTLRSTKEKPSHLTPSIHFLMDLSNTEQLPVVVQLMERIGGKLPQNLLDSAKGISMVKEKKTKTNKLFCKNIKMFGWCWDESKCSNRHVFIPELDVSKDLPSCGFVSMQVTQVHCASHYSVRLVEHTDVNRKKIKWPSGYVKIGLMMSSYFKKQGNKILITKINVGDLFAVEPETDLFQRVQVLELNDIDRHGKPKSVLVKYIDEGHLDNIKEAYIYDLPEELKAFPAQVVDVFLCGLLPADQDNNYGADANNSVKKWMKLYTGSDESKQTLLHGQVMLSMAGSLWVDPVNILEWLPHLREYNVRRNINQSLLLAKYALPNQEHLPKMFKLCGKDISVLSSTNASVQCPIKPKAQPAPSWAFLETDVFEEIEFICAESVSVFFVRKVKFQSLLKELVKDMNANDIPRKSAEVSLLTPGSICLAKYENEWHRVRITSQSEDRTLTTVFYVDFGDSENKSHEDIKCIPEWAITRLPFQAIECSLTGVSSCDDVNKLVDLAENRGLVAKVSKRKDAVLTGGSHYVVAIVDCSRPNPVIINNVLLAVQGVEKCEEELDHLNFEINDLPVLQCNTVEEDPELDLSDLEFNEGDFAGVIDDDTDDGFGNFEVFGLEQLAESFKRDNEAAVEELSNQMKLSALAQQPQPEGIPKNQMSHTKKENVSGKPVQAEDVEEDENCDWEEEEHEYVGRSVLPTLCCARPPTTKWLEDLFYVWIKICITGVESYFLQWTCDSFQFSTFVNGRLYHIDQNLRGAIIPSCVTSSVKGFSVEIKMKKAYSGMLWERLLFPHKKFAWLTRDLEAIDLNSSDSEAEDALKNINKEIRKMPLKLRRRPLNKFEKNQEIKPDLDSDSADSDHDYEMVDSDEMF